MKETTARAILGRRKHVRQQVVTSESICLFGIFSSHLLLVVSFDDEDLVLNIGIMLSWLFSLDRSPGVSLGAANGEEVIDLRATAIILRVRGIWKAVDSSCESRAEARSR